MLFLIHIETCGYYAVSSYEGIASNHWVYQGHGIAYIRCFYLATKTATSIGNNPKPTNELEYIFMTLYWLSGVFVFALLIGQIRDIVEAAGNVKDTYRKKMDSCHWYMQSINMPQELKERVRQWFLYNWDQQKTIDERSLVSSLPKKLQADLAINVHFNTLSKVRLFQDCERNLLYDLVLKLKPILFLPGDYICRKGEVGKEMYIVTQGEVEVLGGEKNSTVLATLKEGSVFGEISLLAMSGGGNRRTADVRCKGYTNVFTLSKHDFQLAMMEYPEAQAILRKRAQKLLKFNARLEQRFKEDRAAETGMQDKQSHNRTEMSGLSNALNQVADDEQCFAPQISSSDHNQNFDSRRSPMSRDQRDTKDNCMTHLSVDSLSLYESDEKSSDSSLQDLFDDFDELSLSDVLHGSSISSSFGEDDAGINGNDGSNPTRYADDFIHELSTCANNSPGRCSGNGCLEEQKNQIFFGVTDAIMKTETLSILGAECDSCNSADQVDKCPDSALSKDDLLSSDKLSCSLFKKSQSYHQCNIDEQSNTDRVVEAHFSPFDSMSTEPLLDKSCLSPRKYKKKAVSFSDSSNIFSKSNCCNSTDACCNNVSTKHKVHPTLDICSGSSSKQVKLLRSQSESGIPSQVHVHNQNSTCNDTGGKDTAIYLPTEDFFDFFEIFHDSRADTANRCSSSHISGANLPRHQKKDEGSDARVLLIGVHKSSA
ncbi:cyclic nucleotide-gated cation channel [Plakobranchus ocellatus]|uniref:Cyclic nucleotide-gated cation channel n=1 Tax=Plakobranchus ocellatus TaxID=259542 RepID=A0AAV4DPE8_9GAST|nr:cyclic nucleotide-gated cation channel [Plakobranchus ocellatus]